MQPRPSDDAVPTPVPVPARTRAAKLAEGTVPVAAIPKSSRMLWLVLVLTAAVIALGVSTVMYMHAQRREAFEAAYPVVPDAAGQELIAREGPRWAKGEVDLLRAMDAFHAPALASLIGAGACPFTAAPKTFAAGTSLSDDVRAYVDDTVRGAARARFQNDAERDDELARLAAPIAVTAGGVVYAFDPATGHLACAGAPGALRAVE